MTYFVSNGMLSINHFHCLETERSFTGGRNCSVCRWWISWSEWTAVLSKSHTNCYRRCTSDL